MHDTSRTYADVCYIRVSFTSIWLCAFAYFAVCFGLCVWCTWWSGTIQCVILLLHSSVVQLRLELLCSADLALLCGFVLPRHLRMLAEFSRHLEESSQSFFMLSPKHTAMSSYRLLSTPPPLLNKRRSVL